MFILILGTLASVLAFYIHHHYTFWQRKGFPVANNIGTNIPFGCLTSVVKRQRSLGMAIYDVYKESSERFLGIYLLFRPAILVRDAQLARQIMVQDFQSFHDRGIYCDEKNYPFSGKIIALKGERWKQLRAKMAPSFSSGKIKAMFGTIEDVANKMIQHLDKIIPEKKYDEPTIVEIKELLATYAIDIIGSVIFGLEVDSFKDPNNKLRTIRELWTNPNFGNTVRTVSMVLCPVDYSILNGAFPQFKKISFLVLESNHFLFVKFADLITQMVRETVEFREKNNISRKDLMQMLIQLRNTGKVNSDDNNWDLETSSSSTKDGFKSMSIEFIAAQAFTFFTAGFESSASTAAFTMFELSKNPELYAKVQQDIEQAIQRHNGEITYESIQDMKYLDMCLMETMRKYPSLPILNRECTKDFQIPDSDKIIKKGTPIIISLFGIQRDPKYFPDPMKYDPDRFLESNKNFNSVAYMPFGEGPKQCIAQRLGKVNVKVALAKIMTNYDFDVINKDEIEIDNFHVTIMPKGGVNLKLRRKNK